MNLLYRSIRLIALLTIVCSFGRPVRAQVVFDPGFHNNSISLYAYYYGSFAYPAVSTRPYQHMVNRRGRIIVAGTGFSNLSGTIYRFTDKGFIDPTFGSSGTVDLYTTTEHMVMQNLANDTMLILGTSSDHQMISVVKLDSNGNNCGNFGSNGQVRFYVPQNLSYFGGIPSAVAVQPDGRILLTITALTFFPPTVVVRLMPNGQFDNSFGQGGSIMLPFGSCGFQAVGIHPLANGKIMIGGNYYSTSSQQYYGACRLTAGGNVDSSYGEYGAAHLMVEFNGNVAASSVLADGRIVLAGNGLNLLRYTADGKPDSTFGVNGIWYGGVTQGCLPTALQTDSIGRHYVYGRYPTGNTFQPYKMFLTRVTPDGRLDSSFNGTGSFTFEQTGNCNTSSMVRLDNDRILMMGETGDLNYFYQLFLAQVYIRPYLASGLFQYCSGDTATLNVFAATGAVRWLRNGSLIADTGRAIRVTQDGNYCAVTSYGAYHDTSGTRQLLFHVPVQPVIMPGGGDTLSVSGGLSWQWYDSTLNAIPGANSSTFHPNVAGTYYVTVTDANGCHARSNGYAYQPTPPPPPTGVVQAASVLSGVNVFPNPFTDALYLKNQYPGKVTISMFDVPGRLIVTAAIEPGTHAIKLPAGLPVAQFYFIKVAYEGQVTVLKLYRK